MNRQTQIEKLQGKIQDLIDQEVNDVQSNVLPFIQAGNAILVYNNNNNLTFFELAVTKPENKNKLYNFIAGRQDEWSYHIGCPIDKHVSIRSDDGRFSVCFDYSGKPEEIKKQVIAKLKQLKLKVDFTKRRQDISDHISKLKNELMDLRNLETEFNG